MRGTGKKLPSLESGRPCSSNSETGCKLISLLKVKKGIKISCNKKKNAKLKSHANTIDSTLSKWKETNFLDKGTEKNDSANRKLIDKKHLYEKFNTKSSNKMSSSRLHGEKRSHSCYKESEENVNEGVKTRRMKKKRSSHSVEVDEASRLKRRTRYLLIKMKLEQNLIDAYSGEGWRGQSREKIKPEKELERAKKQILKCKLGIRDAIRQLHLLGSAGSIEDSLIAPDGSVHYEYIFCAKCKLREAFPDNDIILCDGTCNAAFHQKCLDPPLDTKNIPPGDQGWFCRYCECKMEILEAVNAHLGIHFSVNSNWQDVFKEEAAFPDGGKALINPDEEWPSDDSEDDDYDPLKKENNPSISGEGTDDDVAYDELSADSGIASDDSIDAEIICDRRQRKDVDYKKLHDEMFGKDGPAYDLISEDEDWGPGNRRRRQKESDAASTLMTLYESERKCSNDTREMKRKLSNKMQIRRSFFRIPRNAVERLREVFSENELPSSSLKEKLSKELGLNPERVSKWFKNARYLSLRNKKAEKSKQLPTSSPGTFENSERENFLKQAADHEAMEDTLRGRVIHNSNDVNKTSADHEAIEDTLTGRVIHNSNDVNKSFHRKHHETLNRPSKKRQHQLFDSPANSKKDPVKLRDNTIMKKLLKSRIEEKERINAIVGGGCRAAEVEMERLCEIKDRLESMKQKLLKFQNYKANNLGKQPLSEECVIYVPVAELREKA